MADYSESKNFGTLGYPVEAQETTSLFRRCEPILTPEQLVSRYMKGLEDEVAKYSDEELKVEIELSMNRFEVETKLPITRIQHKERVPFDRAAYQAFVYMKLNNGPIRSIEEVQIQSSNGENIYKLPADWIEMGLAHKRQINLIPILSIFGAAGLKDGQASNAGLIFLQAVNNFRWLPAFYTVVYTTGLTNKDGEVPVVVNDVIGMTTAIEILSTIQTNIKFNSTSISQDGISQSASGKGPETYQRRIDDLTAKRDKLVRHITKTFSQKYFVSNI